MAQEKEVNIRELNPLDIEPSSILAFVASPGSGKSVLTNDICYLLRHRYPVIKVYCETNSENGDYDNFVPPLYINDEYDEKTHETLYMRQKKCKQEKCKNRNMIMIMDDCNTNKKIWNSAIMKAQFKNGRHWDMLAIFIQQATIGDIPPELRKCIAYAFIFREPSQAERKKLYENYSVAVSFDEFNQLMDTLTEDHTCLVFKKRGDSNTIEECVFYYKAHYPVRKWKFGCDEFKKWSDERYNKNYKPSIFM